MGRDSRKKKERRLGLRVGRLGAQLKDGTLELRGPFEPAEHQQKSTVMVPSAAINADRPNAEPWTSRYLEYARHEGTPDPAVMVRRDENRFPGGKMVGFILWIGARWAQWRELRGLKHDAPLADTHHEDFDGWLKTWVDEKTRRIIMPAPQQLARPR